MTPQQSQKELVEEFNRHKLEVSNLRNALNALDKEKELWFKKKGELSGKIRDSIQKIKDYKAKRDSLTEEVKGLKQKRDSLNKDISSKSGDVAKLKKERASLSESLGIKETLSGIKQSIDKLEFRIETEPMPFDREQALMKKIKELRKLHDRSRVLEEADKRLNEFIDKVRKMRLEANNAHNTIQEKAAQSQALHESILKHSSEVDKLKADEEEAFKKFSAIKKGFNETNLNLKEKLKVINSIKNDIDRIKSEKKERKKQEEELFLKSKEEEASRKIKRGEKLTTEDLLVFQNTKGT